MDMKRLIARTALGFSLAFTGGGVLFFILLFDLEVSLSLGMALGYMGLLLLNFLWMHTLLFYTQKMYAISLINMDEAIKKAMPKGVDGYGRVH